MENNEFKKVCIKNRACYYFDDIIKLKELDLENILIIQKSQENILTDNVSYKYLIYPKPYLIYPNPKAY